MTILLSFLLAAPFAILILATVRTHRQNARSYTYIRPAELRSALLAESIASSNRIISETARSAEEAKEKRIVAQMGADRP